LRHELLETIPARDLQTCMRVLVEIRNRAASVPIDPMNGNGSKQKAGSK